MKENNNQEIFHKQIDLVQGVINRMANNSFAIKRLFLLVQGIALSAIIMQIMKQDGISSNETKSVACLIVILFTLVFWYLDAFFLKTERIYRNWYSYIIENQKETQINLYELNPVKIARFLKKDINILKVMFSQTLWPLYLLPSVTIIIFLFV